MKKTKLKANYVIGYDKEKQDHIIYKDGQVIYQGDSVLYVGKANDEPVDETIELGNSVISPGFIDLNALGDIDHDILHMEMPSRKGKNLLWSKEYFYDRKECMTEEEEEFKSLYAYTQLILNGVTTAMPITSVLYKKWAETYGELAAAAHHAGRLGLRIYLGPSYQYATNVVNEKGNIETIFDEEEGRKGLERAVEFIKEFDGSYGGLVRGALEPERIENQTKESLCATKKYSEELNVPIKLHAGQSGYEYNFIYDKYGMTPVQFLDSIGFLGKNVGLAHCHFRAGYKKVDKGQGDDLEILKKTNTTVIHCPVIFGRYGEYTDSFGEYNERGINLAIGTDTFPPDFFQNIRVASTISRIFRDEKVEGSSYADIYKAATIGGSQMLGRDDLGRLCEGAKADIIVVDLEGYHMGPLDDPIRTMFVNGSGRDIVLSIINGKTVMKDRKIQNVNLEELKRKAQKYYDKMRLTYMERSPYKASEKQFFNSSFEVR